MVLWDVTARKDVISLFITMWYIQEFYISSANSVQTDLTAYKRCVRHAIDLYTNFQNRVCDNRSISGQDLDLELWIATECRSICKGTVVSKCSAQGRATSLRLNISAISNNVFFPVVETQPTTKCANCHNIEEAIINCNIDNLFLAKDCNESFATGSTMIKETATLSPKFQTTDALTTTSLTTSTSQSGKISQATTTNDCNEFFTTRSSVSKETTTYPFQRTTEALTTESLLTTSRTQSKETFQSSTSNDLPVMYMAAAGFVGIILGVVLTFLGFFLRTHFSSEPSRIKDENQIYNPAYDGNHRFSHSFFKAKSSNDDEYSEISENNNVHKGPTFSTRRPVRKDNDNYDHLNEDFDKKKINDSTYDHAQSHCHTHQKADQNGGHYAQTNPAFADRSYTEVIGEGFVENNEDVSRDQYFVLEKN